MPANQRLRASRRRTASAGHRRLLFAAGDRDGVRHDIEAAIANSLGGMRGKRYFRFRSTVLPKLSPRLRVLVGSAEVLQGGIEASLSYSPELGFRLADVA